MTQSANPLDEFDEDDEIELDPQRRWGREKFIPISAAVLTRTLLDDLGLPQPQCDKFARVCQLLESVIHAEYHQQLKTLKASYQPFDPDADAPRAPVSPEAELQRAVAAADFMDQVVYLLERANYERLRREDLELALKTASHWGVNLSVDFNVFERLDVYSRGDVMSHRTLRRWQNLNRREEQDVAIYQRLVVVFRLRPDKIADANIDTSAIHIKLFKNIPQVDIEMLLPGTQVRMTLLDQGKIWLPTLSGIGLTLWKAVQGALLLVYAGLQGAFAFLMLVGGTLGYGVKSFFGYLNTRNKYQLNLTRNLYYQNLGNNGGVLFRLLDEAEEQDYREMLLAFFLLFKEAGGSGWTVAQLDEAVERRLQQLTKVDVDFEVADALDRLQRLKLVVALPGDKFRAISLNEAQLRLEEFLAKGLPSESTNPVAAPHFRQKKWATFIRPLQDE